MSEYNIGVNCILWKSTDEMHRTACQWSCWIGCSWSGERAACPIYSKADRMEPIQGFKTTGSSTCLIQIW